MAEMKPKELLEALEAGDRTEEMLAGKPEVRGPEGDFDGLAGQMSQFSQQGMQQFYRNVMDNTFKGLGQQINWPQYDQPYLASAQTVSNLSSADRKWPW